MMRSSSWLFSTIIVCLLSYTYGTLYPGLQGRVTNKGFNYAAQVAIDSLAARIKTTKIPDVSGKGHRIEYSLSNIRITGFTKPQSSVVPRAGSGLTWTATSLGLSLHADFRYKFKKGFIHISDHGSIDVSIENTHFGLSVILTKDASGKPSIKSSGCSCDIGHLSIKFHGGTAWLYNLLKGLFTGNIKDQVQKVVCSSAQSAVDKDGEAALGKLPMTAGIDHKKFLLDYRLVSAPVFTSGYMDTFHKGEVYWSAAVSEAPFPAPAVPGLNSTSKMLYFLASDYLINTMAYVAHQHGILVKNLTEKDLPADKRSFLNTTCHGFSLCLGSVIPETRQKFPNCKAELHMVSNKPPKMVITSRYIGVSFGGNISFFARAANQSQFFMFSVSVGLNTTLKVSVKNEMVYATIDTMALSVKPGSSAIGPLDAEHLQQVLNVAMKVYVKPALNKLGAKGFILPVTGRVKFSNTELSLAENAFILGTDLTYSPNEMQQNEFRVITGNEGFKRHRGM